MGSKNLWFHPKSQPPSGPVETWDHSKITWYDAVFGVKKMHAMSESPVVDEKIDRSTPIGIIVVSLTSAYLKTT